MVFLLKYFKSGEAAVCMRLFLFTWLMINADMCMDLCSSLADMSNAASPEAYQALRK